MASPDSPTLGACSRLHIGHLAQRLPQPHAGLRVSVVEPLRVLSLRCLPGGASVLAAVLGAPELPGPGGFAGTESMLLWRRPGEWMKVGTQDEPADRLLQALPAGGIAQAVDLSHGMLALSLEGDALDALLARLFDATVPLAAAGRAACTRLGSVAVMSIRLSESCLWLIADRANDRHLTDWIADADEAVRLSVS